MASEDVQLAYHRKYRPSKMSGYIGNQKLKETALASLRSSIKPQVILLEGASGCGKTTFARLLVKEYRCENRDDYEGACDECISCNELEDYITTGDASNLVDIREVDIASEGGKKDVDAVLEEAMYPSYGGQWKIFIFDECHMATKQAQNRMLKIAEEPPENVLLIFCTTDPDMMLETLLNRCQLRLHVTKPTVKELGGLLKSVCINEGVDYDIKGVNLIANRSGLTIRRALILLQDIVNQKNSAKYSDVIDVLDEISESTMFDFYRKLLNKDTMGYVTLLHKIKTQMELRQFVDSILEFTKRGVLIINGVNLDGMTDGELKSYKNLFSKFTVEQIGMLLEKLLSLRDGDIELKLIMMGYTGLTRHQTEVSGNELDLLEVNKQENELVAEKEEHLRQTQKSFEVDEEAQQERVTELEQEMDFDGILDLFGNVEVDDIPN